MYKDEQLGCTDRLQTWNKPRKRNVEARPTDEVTLNKMEYGIEKRIKLHRFINRNSRGDKIVSGFLRQVVLKMMTEYPDVRLEDGLSTAQWLQKKQATLDPAQWGGDLEVWLLAIGLKRDVVVLTAAHDGSTYARQFPSQPPPISRMRGGIFIPLSSSELCGRWKSLDPTPLLIIYNGHSHYRAVGSNFSVVRPTSR